MWTSSAWLLRVLECSGKILLSIVSLSVARGLKKGVGSDKRVVLREPLCSTFLCSDAEETIALLASSLHQRKFISRTRRLFSFREVSSRFWRPRQSNRQITERETNAIAAPIHYQNTTCAKVTRESLCKCLLVIGGEIKLVSLLENRSKYSLKETISRVIMKLLTSLIIVITIFSDA